MDLGLGRWIYIVLRQHGSAWCLSGPLKRLAYSICCSVSLHLKRSMGDSEPPDIFQHQSTGYLRTRGQETLYETYGGRLVS